MTTLVVTCAYITLPQSVLFSVAIDCMQFTHLSPDDVIHFQYCSNLQASKHYLIRATNYLRAQNESENSSRKYHRNSLSIPYRCITIDNLYSRIGYVSIDYLYMVYITFFVSSICFALLYGEVSDPRTLPHFGHFELLRRMYSSRNVFAIKFQFGIKLILYLRSKVLNNCNRLSYMMFESRRRPELGTTRSILGSWKLPHSTSKSNRLPSQ